MKQITILLSALFLLNVAYAQKKEIKLNDPDKNRGTSVMKALSDRASSRAYAEKSLSMQDLSDLLWAAYGINRPDGKRTAPTAVNAQDIILYACLPEGSYLYNAKENVLELVSEGDLRPALAVQQAFVKSVPVVLVLVSDLTRFRMDVERSRLWGAMDAGFVSQNINIFCAAVGLATVPRAFMDVAKVKEGLKLTENQVPMLNNPVGYPKD